MPINFSSRLPRSSKEVIVVVSMSYLSFIQNLLKGDKTEITLELAHNMFKAASIFSLNYTGHGDVLSPDNPFKEWDAWKEKAEALELKCTNL